MTSTNSFFLPRCVCKNKTEPLCITYKVDTPICTDISEKECKIVTKKICETITVPMNKSYEEEKCETVDVEKCDSHWICQNEDCSTKVWGENKDACNTYPITECKHIWKNKIETKIDARLRQTTIEVCKNVPKTKCRISQVDKTDCTTEPIEVHIMYFVTKSFLKIFWPLF